MIKHTHTHTHTHTHILEVNSSYKVPELEVGFGGGEMKIGELISYIPFCSWSWSLFGSLSAWVFTETVNEIIFEATDKYFIHWPRNGEARGYWWTAEHREESPEASI